jgi:hypothetical protein
MTARPTLELAWVEGRWAVCRLPADAPAPELPAARFVTVSRTTEELSLVCDEELAPAGAKREGPYALFRVAGELPLGLTGILLSLLDPLAGAGLAIFAISTFDTDYVMVKAADRARAEQALLGAGHRFVSTPSRP